MRLFFLMISFLTFPNLVLGVSMPSILRRHHIHQFPETIHLSSSVPVQYLHSPNTNMPQITCASDICPTDLICQTGGSAYDPFSWNCTFYPNLKGIKLITIDNYFIEGWQQPREREYVNIDSLSMEISVYNVNVNFTSEQENRPITVIVLFLSALFIVALTRSFTCLVKLDASEKSCSPQPHIMLTRLQKKKRGY